MEPTGTTAPVHPLTLALDALGTLTSTQSNCLLGALAVHNPQSVIDLVEWVKINFPAK